MAPSQAPSLGPVKGCRRLRSIHYMSDTSLFGIEPGKGLQQQGAQKLGDVLNLSIMGRQEWLNKIIYFQARCRGYMVRRELRCVRAEYEEIVRELEGGVEHLSWRGELIPKPRFTEECDSFRYPQPKIQTQECPERVQEVKEQDETLCLHSEAPEKVEEKPSCDPERDCRNTNTPPGGDTELDGVQREDVTQTAAQALHMSHSILQHVPPMHTLLKDVPHTPEALKQHRNTLAMELLWIQQAISSRKKYLTLKLKMAAS